MFSPPENIDLMHINVDKAIVIKVYKGALKNTISTANRVLEFGSSRTEK